MSTETAAAVLFGEAVAVVPSLARAYADPSASEQQRDTTVAVFDSAEFLGPDEERGWKLLHARRSSASSRRHPSPVG